MLFVSRLDAHFSGALKTRDARRRRREIGRQTSEPHLRLKVFTASVLSPGTRRRSHPCISAGFCRAHPAESCGFARCQRHRALCPCPVRSFQRLQVRPQPILQLSAFLICELLLREREAAGTVGVRQFYIRRILRIWPLYYLGLALGAVAAFLPGGEPASALKMGWFAIFMGAWCLMTRSAFNNPAGVLWSISIEEQFYLFAPWIVKYLSRKSLYAFCLANILVANVWLFYLGKLHTSYKPIWFNSFVQFECFACGILLCLILRSKLPKIAVWKRMLLVGCGLFGWFSACYWLHNDFAYPGENPGSWPLIGGYALGALGAVLILFSFLGLNPRLVPGWAVYLGRISFGLYVYHLFALDITNHLLIEHLASISGPIFILKAVVTLGLNILMAAISYHFFELPFLRMKSRHTFIESEPIGANVNLS